MHPSRLERALAGHGLRLLGGFRPRGADELPALPEGRPVAALWLAGQVGSEVWPHFDASPIAHDGAPDPMDRWAQSIGRALASARDGLAVFPSDGPPWPPFLRWAQRANPARPSPLGLLIHPERGLWQAFRFALLLPDVQPDEAAWLDAAPAAGLPPPGAAAEVCLRCRDTPCLRTCPVDAFQPGHYAVDRCADHLHGPHGADCMQGGCLARRACPVGASLRYEPAHAAFHMRAFAQQHSR